MDNPLRSEPFKCKKIRIDFIYSFCLSTKADEPLSEQDFLALVQSDQGWHDDLPEDRKHVISPFLLLKMPRAFKQIKSTHATVGGRNITLSTFFRLFALGGTCTITFELNDEQSPPNLSFGDAHELYDVLRKSLDQAPSSSIVFPEQNARPVSHDSLYDFFKHVLGRECVNGLKWFDVDNKIIDDESSEPQSPWLVTTFEVSGDEEKAFCTGTDNEQILTAEEKYRRISLYEYDLGPILFRSVTGARFPVEPTYRGGEGGISGLLAQHLSNMHLDARMFVCSSRRNVLCITPNIGGAPATYFLPGIISICEMVRARWHSLIILNRYLDFSS